MCGLENSRMHSINIDFERPHHFFNRLVKSKSMDNIALDIHPFSRQETCRPIAYIERTISYRDYR